MVESRLALSSMVRSVPLIVDAPNVPGNGKACDSIVQSIDIYPTLVDLCGLPQPAGLEGRSLVHLLYEPDRICDNHPAFTIWSEDGKTANAISIRRHGWRYTEYDGPNGGALLFYLPDDPHELHDLADDPQLKRDSRLLFQVNPRVPCRVTQTSTPADETSRGPS